MTATSAATFWPALSSDARMVVYVSDAGKDGESPQVWLQQVGGAAVQLTSGQRDCAEPTFSADDTRVLFTATGESTRNVYEIPTLGGQPRLVRRAARNARFSPDGKWLAYIAIGARDSLRVVPTDGGAERTLATDLVDIACATWSDDGRHLLVVAHPDPSVELDCWIVPLEGGDAARHRRHETRPAARPHRDSAVVRVGEATRFSIRGQAGRVCRFGGSGSHRRPSTRLAHRRS